MPRNGGVVKNCNRIALDVRELKIGVLCTIFLRSICVHCTFLSSHNEAISYMRRSRRGHRSSGPVGSEQDAYGSTKHFRHREREYGMASGATEPRRAMARAMAHYEPLMIYATPRRSRTTRQCRRPT